MDDNKDMTETDLNTGNVVTYMFGRDAAEDQGELEFAIDDTVNIPRGEYEDLLDDSVFLHFLEETVGPEVWDAAHAAYDQWNEAQEAAND